MVRNSTRQEPRLPNISQSVDRIIRDVSTRLPEFEHVDSSRVLTLLGEARRASRASVRPMHFAETATRQSASGKLVRPRVRFKGRNIYYVLTLRPLFFLDGSPQMRIATIIHEMFHFSERFDGTLDPAKRHSELGANFCSRLAPLVDRYLEQAPHSIRRSMAIDGPVRVRMWLEKPGLATVRIKNDGKRIVRGKRIYTERHTFLTTFGMKTSREFRSRGDTDQSASWIERPS